MALQYLVLEGRPRRSSHEYGAAPEAAMLREEHLTTTRQIVVASRDLGQTGPALCSLPATTGAPTNHLGRAGSDSETGLGWGWQPRALVQPRMAAGTLVEMPFENLSNGAALWVDVVWSKSGPWA